MEVVNNINQWLSDHPEWILGTELKAIVGDDFRIRDVIKKREFGFLTEQGEYYNRLRDVPHFVGLRQVIKAKNVVEELHLTK